MNRNTSCPQEPPAVVNARGRGSLVITCEHAARLVPPHYENLGLAARQLDRHIGWDIGARAVAEVVSSALDAPAVFAPYSRLLIDCNRDLGDHDLIAAQSDGAVIPANRAVAAGEKSARIERFYRPFHRAVDRVLEGRRGTSLLLSLHSFAPVLGAQRRDFDVGVLFDEYKNPAAALGGRLAETGLRTRYNEPYSGEAGLIFSARSHGKRHGVPYLELEINQSLIASTAGARAVGRKIVKALTGLLACDLPSR